MLSATLSQGLARYEIGSKLRALRLKKKMGLVELGTHTGLSAAMLSKVERGRLFPTLPTLLRIALVFSVDLEHFFRQQDRPMVACVRRKDRARFPERAGTRHPAYFFECLDYPATKRPMNSYFVQFESLPPGAEKSHHHPGAELLFVIQGRVAVCVGGDEHTLEAGDALYFDSSQPHSYRRLGSRRSSAVVVTAP